jgi:thiosulfate dehydrogenase
VTHAEERGERHDYQHDAKAQNYIHGKPSVPSDPWTIAAGGRIYDNWWEALDRKAPVSTHPAYPASGKKSGAATWRCKECHGWDYRGRDGVYGKGSHYTGIKGIAGAAGKPEAEIAAIVRGSEHGYTPEMISDRELMRLAAFVSRGQVDMSKHIDLATRTLIAGDPERGRGVFQTVCAACHGYDGRLLDWGGDGEHAYVGTEAKAAPDEVLHKILNGHPGVAMVNLRAFPVEDAVDVLSYAANLPTN